MVRVAKQKATPRNSPYIPPLAACYKNRCVPRPAFNLFSAWLRPHSNLPVINSWAKSITAYVKERWVEEQVDMTPLACVSGLRDGGGFVRATGWWRRSNIQRFHRPEITVFWDRCRGEFRPRQTRQLPRAVDLKGRLLSIYLSIYLSIRDYSVLG